LCVPFHGTHFSLLVIELFEFLSAYPFYVPFHFRCLVIYLFNLSVVIVLHFITFKNVVIILQLLVGVWRCGDWCRPMQMGKPLCLFKKGKLALENFMVSDTLRRLNFLNFFRRPLNFDGITCSVCRSKFQAHMFCFLWTAVIFPSLLQLQGGITDVEDRKQKEACTLRYRRKDELGDKGKLSEFDIEREEECGICLEMNSKVVLPNCSHSLCLRCYQDW
jgi:hypothetical protein